ncbi:hypothetical protein BJ165DRAFT_1402006 [Panaeolus papilionaceus]|nr:hypothetical protein BJ165DRAFT_1402006 [Panaeolus papilionaceus]
MSTQTMPFSVNLLEPPALPYDVLLLLISQLDPIDPEDRHTLASWARVGTLFREAAQARLFSALRVTFSFVEGQMLDNISQTHMLMRTITSEESSYLAKTVRHLEVCLNMPAVGDKAATMGSLGSTLEILMPRLINLKGCTVSFTSASHFKILSGPRSPRVNWRDLKEEAQAALRMVLQTYPLKRITIMGIESFPAALLCLNGGLRVIEVPYYMSRINENDLKDEKYISLTALAILGADDSHSGRERGILHILQNPRCPLKLTHLKELCIMPNVPPNFVSSLLSLCSNDLASLELQFPSKVEYTDTVPETPSDTFAPIFPIVDLRTFTNISHLVINSKISRERENNFKTRFPPPDLDSHTPSPFINCLTSIGSMLETLSLTEPANMLSFLRVNLHITTVQIESGRIPWSDIVDPLLRLRSRFKRIEVVISFTPKFVPFTTRNNWHRYLKSEESLQKLGSIVAYDDMDQLW